MNHEQALTVVSEWLSDRELPALTPRMSRPIEAEHLKRILAVVGPRRAGKTYYLFQLIQALIDSGRWTRRDILFLDFEDYHLSGFKGADMDVLLTAFLRAAGRPPRFLFFDEVQRIDDWGRILRTLHNTGRYRIIVSGSNARLLHAEVATELRGRYEDLRLLPFSFAERLDLRGVDRSVPALHTPARGRILEVFDDYLAFGGFPEVVLEAGVPARRNLLQNYLRTIFHRDILDRHGIRARHLLDALQRALLEEYATTFSITRFEKQLKQHDLPGSKRTISNYLDFLREAFFILVNEKFSHSVRRRTMNPKKTYLLDPGFADLGQPSSENRGRRLENAVAIELFRRERDAFYHKGRRECDFVVRGVRRIEEAIQVTWELTERNRKREFDGLVEACREYGLATGRLLTYDQEAVHTVDGVTIRVEPVWKWLLA
jgi:predicted AAA+ superfamily ATPase